MGWIETKGRSPQKTEQKYFCRFRNGYETKHSYKASEMQWGHHRKNMDDDYDITHVRPA